MKSKREIELTDEDGSEHTYVMIQFGAIEGIELAPLVIECLAEPIGNAIQAFMGSRGFMPETQPEETAGDVPESGLSGVLDADFDATLAGKAVAELARKIAKAGGAKFMLRLFAHTMRDGKKLADKTNFDQAYQGNYLELMRAIGWVVVENYAGAFRKMANPFILGSQSIAD